jgi:acetyl-CoA carboxylase carboxyltransferase component
LFADQIEGMDEETKAAFIESAKDEFDKYIDIRSQASQMQVDELLPAGDLREQLERRLDTYCGNKVREERPRHHGTVFF